MQLVSKQPHSSQESIGAFVWKLCTAVVWYHDFYHVIRGDIISRVTVQPQKFTKYLPHNAYVANIMGYYQQGSQVQRRQTTWRLANLLFKVVRFRCAARNGEARLMMICVTTRQSQVVGLYCSLMAYSGQVQARSKADGLFVSLRCKWVPDRCLHVHVGMAHYKAAQRESMLRSSIVNNLAYFQNYDSNRLIN